MIPSNRWILLAISLSLLLTSGVALADEEIASDADLAHLAALNDKLEARFQANLRAKVDAVIEAKVGRVLAAHTTELLNSRIRLAKKRGDAPPAELQEFADDRPTSQVQLAYDTTCTMLGRTLECVLRD